MLIISPTLSIPLDEVSYTQIRAQGSGGQNVNKVSSAVQLRFDIAKSSLPAELKQRLLSRADSRINKSGVLVIKSQNHRTLERNKEEALERLTQVIRSATAIRKKRKPTKPSKMARQKRLDSKTKAGKLKKLRKKVTH